MTVNDCATSLALSCIIWSVTAVCCCASSNHIITAFSTRGYLELRCLSRLATAACGSIASHLSLPLIIFATVVRLQPYFLASSS
ncbi:hypothetical protein F4703DRAFT_1885900 [Phycomyces blakesleeanus]